MYIRFTSSSYTKSLIALFEQKREARNETASLIEYSHHHRLAENHFDKKKLFADAAYQHSHKQLIDELPFITFSEYMQFVMFESSKGYYSSGKVNFGLDFSTNATEGCGLAFTNLMDMFRQWMDSGQPKEFYNYEGGAGNGLLAYHTLFFAEMFALMSEKNNEFNLQWRKFYDALHYVIVELSPALVERQSESCQKYIDKNKIQILKASVYDFKPKTKIHRYCSNELLDDLPLEGFRKDQENNVLVLTKLQVVPKNLMDVFTINSSQFDIAKLDQDYRESLLNIFGISDVPKNVYIVNTQLLSQLPNELKYFSQYHDVYLPLQYFEFSLSILKDHFYIMPDLTCHKTIFVSAYLNIFAKMIQSADKILFFDYGGIDKQVSSRLRYYDNPDEGELQKPTLFTFADGLQINFGNTHHHNPYIQKNLFVNITHDVDYYAVMRIFEKYKFKTECYGHQSLILNLMDQKSLEQAISMYYNYIEENGYLINRGNGHKSLDHDTDILNSGIRNFQGWERDCRFIAMVKQPELAANYHPLPSLKNNYIFWHKHEKRCLEEYRREFKITKKL